MTLRARHVLGFASLLTSFAAAGLVFELALRSYGVGVGLSTIEIVGVFVAIPVWSIVITPLLAESGEGSA